VELDRDGDGQPDRTEYYETPIDEPGADSPLASARIARAEEIRDGSRVVRWEFYDGGVIERVEEDTTGDGRVDKWERYRNGRLAQLDLDLAGTGTPGRRLLYGPDGELQRVEMDRDGTGRFEPAGAQVEPAGAQATR
jgi:hypothetical protein